MPSVWFASLAIKRTAAFPIPKQHYHFPVHIMLPPDGARVVVMDRMIDKGKLDFQLKEPIFDPNR